MKPDKKFLAVSSISIVKAKISRTMILSAFLSISLFFFIVFNPSTVYAAEPSLLFSQESKSIAINQTFNIDIILDTAGEQAGGVDAVVKYKPSLIQGISIQTGQIFSDYPAAIIDNQKGQINISGIASSKNRLYSGKGTLATITFKGVSSGKAIINFNYLPGSTRDSNIAVLYGTGDVLGRVNSLTVTIQQTELPTDDEDSQTNGETPTTYIIRPTSKPLDPHEPITSQSPITDPSLEQPTEVEEEISFKSTKPPLSNTAKTVLVAGFMLTSIVVVSLLFMLIRRRKKPPLPPTSPPEVEQPM